MSEKTAIGRIGKIGIKELDANSKKICEVPILFFSNAISADFPGYYDAKVTIYYDQLKQWIEKVIEDLGEIKRFFVESITKTGEKARDQLQNLLEKNKPFSKVIDQFFKMGANLEQTEDEMLVMEYLAWVGDLSSPDALEIDQKYVIELMKERATYMIKKIIETLSETESTFLFLSYDLAKVMNYPEDIQVIKFRPPIFDDILKLLRELQ